MNSAGECEHFLEPHNILLLFGSETIGKFAGISFIEIGVSWEFLFVIMFKEYFKLFE